MADKSSIQWTDSTWNPIRGCSRVSPGCGGPNHEGGCYAEKIAARFSGHGQPYDGFAVRDKHGGHWTNKVALVESQLDLPLRWKKPRRIFVNSMSDLFHENLSFVDIARVFFVMTGECSAEPAPTHTYQILTKRPAQMLKFFQWLAEPARTDDETWLFALHTFYQHHVPPYIWLGVSVEDQERADERIPLLLETPAAIRFLSCEPLLGPLVIRNYLMAGRDPGQCGNCGHGHGFTRCPNYGGIAQTSDKGGGCTAFKRINFAINWVIVGGESGHGARPFYLPSARGIVKQCSDTYIACYMKQLGAEPRSDSLRRIYLRDRKGGDMAEWPADLRVREWPT